MPENTERKRNILILTSTFPRWRNDTVPGFVFDFAKHVKVKNWQPTVLAPHYPGAKKREEMQGVTVKRFQYWVTKKGQTIAYNGGAVHNLKKTPPYALKVCCYMATMFVVAVNIVLKQRITVLNPHWLIPQGFVAIFVKHLTGKKVVVTIHGGDVFSLNGTIMRSIKRWVLKRVDEVVVNSSATLEKTQSLYGDREYHVIPMGVDTDLFSPSETERKRGGRFNILFVGRLNEGKGILYLCQATKELTVKGYTNIMVTIAGSGPEKKKIESYIRDNALNDYIKMVGWIDPSKLPTYYRSADVFVGPSIVSDMGLQEAFGLVFAESLATATPVIATKSGGIRDIVIDGENGFLVPDKDAHAIANKLKLVIDDQALLARMQSKARSHIISNFSWEVVAQKYEKILNVAVNHTKG